MAKLKVEEVLVINQLEGNIRLQNNQYLKWRNAANSADVDVFKLDASNNTILSGHWSIASDGTFSAFAGARNFSTSGGSVTAGAFLGSSIDVSGNSEANQFLINGTASINSSNAFVGGGGVNTAGSVIGAFLRADSVTIDSQNIYSSTSLDLGSSNVNQWRIETNGDFNAFNANNISTAGGSVTAGAFFGSSIDVSGNSEANQFLINGSVAINSSNVFVGSGGVSTVGLINTNDRYRIDSVDVIDTGRTFVGSGGVNTTGGVQGSSGTFPTVNTGQVNATGSLGLAVGGVNKWTMSTAVGAGDGSLNATGTQYIACRGLTNGPSSTGIDIGPSNPTGSINFIRNFGTSNNFIAQMFDNQFKFIGAFSEVRLGSETSYGQIVGTNFMRVYVNTSDLSGTFTGTGFADDCDARFKENIVSLNSTKTKIRSVNPIKFNSIGSSVDQLGFTAQDIDSYFPEAVDKTDSGRWALNYSMLIAPLVKALQEAYDEIDTLDARIAALETP